MISVRHLSRRYGPHLAVDDLSFEVEKGEVVGFLGPNGAGKTTTMRILTGFLPASEGSAHVAGHDVLRESLAVRERIGYLPETVPLYRELRVEEMLAFQARLHRVPRKEAKARIDRALERVGIAERRRSLVGNLSRGLRQRVGLAVALLPEPEVLILDEPTSGLDPLQRIEVRALVRELAEEHTLLVSSHILPEIEAVCPRVVVLDRGRLVADGDLADLSRDLGGAAHVRFEAVVGPEPAEAARLLGAIAGVDRVEDHGRLGIHHVFDVHCREDLREDVGALAMTKGWAVRELSYSVPDLETLFARLVFGEGDAPAAAPPPAPAQGGAPDPGSELPLVTDDAPSPEEATSTGAPAAAAGFTPLNPFRDPPPSASSEEEDAT